MATVYILESLRHGKRYVGVTERAVDLRIHEHNTGVTPWTRQNSPFRLLHAETYNSIYLAKRRELFLKSGKGRQVLKNLEQNGWNR